MIDNQDGTITVTGTEFVKQLLAMDKLLGSTSNIDALVRAALDGGYKC